MDILATAWKKNHSTKTRRVRREGHRRGMHGQVPPRGTGQRPPLPREQDRGAKQARDMLQQACHQPPSQARHTGRPHSHRTLARPWGSGQGRAGHRQSGRRVAWQRQCLARHSRQTAALACLVKEATISSEGKDRGVSEKNQVIRFCMSGANKEAFIYTCFLKLLILENFCYYKATGTGG